MSKFTKELVDKYADDLLIGLSPEENKMVLDEFDAIEYNMDIISNVEGLDKVTPMTHPYDLYLAKMDEDIIIPSISVNEALANCDKTISNEVVVPKVVG